MFPGQIEARGVGHSVQVQAQDLRPGFGHQAAVAAEAEGSVHQPPSRPGLQQLQGFIPENGDVRRIAHESAWRMPQPRAMWAAGARGNPSSRSQSSMQRMALR